ncbi:uncharacterized protein LJ264_004403 [Porphyrio hochstetteri]
MRGHRLPGAPAQRRRQAAPRRQQREEEEEEGRRRPPPAEQRRRQRALSPCAAPAAAHPPAALPLTGVRRDLRGGRSRSPSARPGPARTGGRRRLPGCERPLGPTLPFALPPSPLLSALPTSPAPERVQPRMSGFLVGFLPGKLRITSVRICEAAGEVGNCPAGV